MKNIFKKTLIATALAGSMAFAISTPASANESQNVEQTAQAGVLTQNMIQKWLDDIVQLAPQLSLKVVDFEGHGANALVTVTMGFQGLDLEELGQKEMRFEVQLIPNAKAADGFDVNVKNAQAITITNKEIGMEIPTVSFLASSDKKAQTAKLFTRVPTINVTSQWAPIGFYITNFEQITNKALTDSWLELKGENISTVESLVVKAEDNVLFSMKNIESSEIHQVDDNHLYHNKFTGKGEGEAMILSAFKREPLPLDPYSINFSGAIDNLQADILMRYLRLDEKALESLDAEQVKKDMFELLRHGPKFSIDDLTFTLHGHSGKLNFSIGFKPFTDEDAEMDPWLLMAQKLQVQTNIDVPVEWGKLVFDKKMLEMFLEAGKEEGYINVANNRIISNIEYKLGNLIVNGKNMSLSNFGF